MIRILPSPPAYADGPSLACLDPAHPQLSEAVIAYASRDSGLLWQQLFQRPYFAINLLADVPGAEMCGTVGCGASGGWAAVRAGLAGVAKQLAAWPGRGGNPLSSPLSAVDPLTTN